MSNYDYKILDQLTRIANAAERIADNLECKKNAEELTRSLETMKRGEWPTKSRVENRDCWNCEFGFVKVMRSGHPCDNCKEYSNWHPIYR